jgi:hypothetical protein
MKLQSKGIFPLKLPQNVFSKSRMEWRELDINQNI